ncbi:unnamed protein product, partial [Hymenolepis diminuta]
TKIYQFQRSGDSKLVEFTTLPTLIKEILSVLDHSGKCERVTNRAASKRSRACRGLFSQSAINTPAA